MPCVSRRLKKALGGPQAWRVGAPLKAERVLAASFSLWSEVIFSSRGGVSEKKDQRMETGRMSAVQRNLRKKRPSVYPSQERSIAGVKYVGRLKGKGRGSCNDIDPGAVGSS